MRNTVLLMTATMLLAACAHEKPPECPKAGDLSSSLDSGWFADLTVRLEGPDRQNSIADAIANLHRTYPEMDATMIADVLIAADCPAATRAALPEDGARRRIATLRAQVEQSLQE